MQYEHLNSAVRNDLVDVGNYKGLNSLGRAIMKKFLFFSGDSKYELDFGTIEKRFEDYLLDKAKTAEGLTWLKEFKMSGMQTIAVIMHFLYDKDWIDTVAEHQEDELIHLLSAAKMRIFRQIF